MAFAFDLGRADDEDVVFFRGDVERIARVQQAHGAVERDFGRVNPRHFAAYAAQGAGVLGDWLRGFRAVAPAVDYPVVLGLQVLGAHSCSQWQGRSVRPKRRQVQTIFAARRAGLRSAGRCRLKTSAELRFAFGDFIGAPTDDFVIRYAAAFEMADELAG